VWVDGTDASITLACSDCIGNGSRGNGMLFKFQL
jgi:hypothetical protein